MKSGISCLEKKLRGSLFVNTLDYERPLSGPELTESSLAGRQTRLVRTNNRGTGWGHLQMLARISPSRCALPDFVRAVEEVLTLRVKSAPPTRTEAQ